MRLSRVTWGLLLWLCATAPGWGAEWRFSNPRPHGNNILDLAIRDTTVWQIGDRGRIYTSGDLDHWIPRESGTFKSLRGITFFGSQVIISGEEGTILSGSGPDQLTVRSLGTSDWLEGIAASPDAVVAVGDNGAIYSTRNGTDWTRRGSYTNWLRSVAFGNGQFLCVGEFGFLASSSDGESWQREVLPSSAHLNKVAWINDRFWIVGEDGTVFTNTFRMAFAPVQTGVTNTLFAIAGNSNEVVLAGDSVVLLGNLQTGSWSVQSDPASATLAPIWPYYSALWDGRLFLLGGRTGMIVEGFRTNEFAPLAWYSDVQPTRSWLWSLTRTPDLYAAAGANGAIVTSEDGVDWAREAVPVEAESEVLLGIGGNTNLLVAVGSRGMILRSENTYTNVVATNSTGQLVTNRISLLGLYWTRIPSPVAEDLQGVAGSSARIVITGAGGRIFTSTDAASWEPRASGVTSFLSGVAAWPGGFVAVGDGGVILTSPDGTAWTRRNSGVEDWIYMVRSVGGKLIAVGENGLLLTSDDGVAWQSRYSGTTEWLNDVTFAQGSWYITGGSGTLVTSSDSINWAVQPAITSKSLYGAATDGEQLIAVGLEGVILRRNLTPATSPVEILSYENLNDTSLFLFSGWIDQQFTLEHTTNLLEPWSPLANLELVQPGGTVIYELPNGTSRQGFFRTKLR